MTQVSARELGQWLDDALAVSRFRDYCPNGLQVEGRPAIRHIITGVTASHALLQAAVDRGADTVLVHHGWFWKNEDARIVGIKQRRLALALRHNLNLFAYHLPLDAHPVWGNNAQLARVLDLQPLLDADGTPSTCGPDGLIWLGSAPSGETLASLGERVSQRLQRVPLVVGNPQQPVTRIAWCTGGAQGMANAALEAGADAYLTGEASEPCFHLAQESGMGFLAAGHHATERYGVQALGAAVAAAFGVKVEFIDIDNPI